MGALLQEAVGLSVAMARCRGLEIATDGVSNIRFGYHYGGVLRLPVGFLA